MFLCLIIKCKHSYCREKGCCSLTLGEKITNLMLKYMFSQITFHIPQIICFKLKLTFCCSRRLLLISLYLFVNLFFISTYVFVDHKSINLE